jgi:hypothetical protein
MNNLDNKVTVYIVGTRPAVRGVQVGAMYALTICMHPLGICKISKPTKIRAMSYRIQVLPLLNHRGWKKLIFKNVCTSICKLFCAILYSELCN